MSSIEEEEEEEEEREGVEGCGGSRVGGGGVQGEGASIAWQPGSHVCCVRGCRRGAHSEHRFPAPSSNSARFSYATEGALFISAQLSTDAVSALRKV